MNIPNALSIFRILLIPVFCAAFLSGPQYYAIAALALGLSGLSDVFDGIIARKFNQITELGKWLDPIADKLTLGAVVACMWIVFHDAYPLLTPVCCILIAKELIMAIGGMIVTHGRTEMIPSQWWGKVGTVVFYLCMIGIVLISAVWGGRVDPIVMALLVILPAVAMLFALARYVIFAIKILRGENKDYPKASEIGENKADAA